MRAAGILVGAQMWLKYGPRLTGVSNMQRFEESEAFFAARDARGEFETCGICHTTNLQKGLKWGYCDSCGAMGVFPTETAWRKAEK